MPGGRSRKYVHLYARPVPRVGLLARRSYATWRSSGAGDTRERWYCSAARRGNSGRYEHLLLSVPIRVACHGGQGGRQGVAAGNMIYVGNCRSQPFTHDSGAR